MAKPSARAKVRGSLEQRARIDASGWKSVKRNPIPVSSRETRLGASPNRLATVPANISMGLRVALQRSEDWTCIYQH